MSVVEQYAHSNATAVPLLNQNAGNEEILRTLRNTSMCCKCRHQTEMGGGGQFYIPAVLSSTQWQVGWLSLRAYCSNAKNKKVCTAFKKWTPNSPSSSPYPTHIDWCRCFYNFSTTTVYFLIMEHNKKNESSRNFKAKYFILLAWPEWYRGAERLMETMRITFWNIKKTNILHKMDSCLLYVPYQQVQIISLCSINRVAFINDTDCVLCDVGFEFIS